MNLLQDFIKTGSLASIPHWAASLLILICIFFFVILPCGSLMVYFERKFAAMFQARVGPNQAGLGGMLQPIADGLKLMQKQGVQNRSIGEGIWLSVHTMALYSTVAVMPMGSTILLVNTDMSAFLPFFSVLVLALGTLLLGIHQKSVPGIYGGIRVVTQALVGVFPALLCVLCAGISAGGFRWSSFALSQSAWPTGWILVASPFEFLAFIIFVISGMILLGISPLDSGHSISDLHGGVASHLYGRRLSFFKLGRFYGFFFWCIMTVVLFLGAWNLPFGLGLLLHQSGNHFFVTFLELMVLLVKVFLLMIVVSWASKSNFRYRIDQVTDFSWKILSPLAIAALIGSSVLSKIGIHF